MVQSTAVGCKTAFGRWAVFFQMALTKAVETEMQTLNMLFSILDGRIEIVAVVYILEFGRTGKASEAVAGVYGDGAVGRLALTEWREA